MAGLSLSVLRYASLCLASRFLAVLTSPVTSFSVGCLVVVQAGLLSADCALLDWSMPAISFKGESAVVNGTLGIGRTSQVYRAVFKSQVVVVKRFASSERAHCSTRMRSAETHSTTQRDTESNVLCTRFGR